MYLELSKRLMTAPQELPNLPVAMLEDAVLDMAAEDSTRDALNRWDARDS